MKGTQELIFGIKSGYSYFYCESQEVNKTVNDIKTNLNTYFSENKNGINFRVNVWDYESQMPTGESIYNSPDEMFMMLENIKSGFDEVLPGQVIIAKNFNWFFKDQYGESNKGMVSWLMNRAAKFSSPDSRKILIIVGNDPIDKAIPEILRRDFASIEMTLPDEEEITKLYDYIIESVKDDPKFKMPSDGDKARIIAGARGLTESEIIKVFSYSLVKGQGVFDPETVEELRAKEINNTPGLKIGKYNKKLDDLKGYDNAKEIVDDWIDDPKAKGVILLGPAGVGKTHFAQSLAGHYNRLIIEIEFAQLMGDGLVGQAEKAMKRALDVIRANANPKSPIVVFCDEIEKGLSGMTGAGSNDGGTSMRSNAQFLKFLSDDRPEGIYVMATCNNIKTLPPEFIRAERYDCAPIFIDLPDRDEQAAILAHYQNVYNLIKHEKPADMSGWSGAEIKTWCKLARKKLDKGKNPCEADELIVPISKTMKEDIDYLRQWKEGRTVPATRRKTMVATKAKRKLDI